MTTVYRGMKDDGEGQPLCGTSARTLGVRLEGDIVIREDGTVGPSTGGMSVAIDDPRDLPPHRRPPEHGGWGSDPVWKIDVDDLPSSLVFRPDPEDPSRHGFIEPMETMMLDEYQGALAATRAMWARA
jgi:hypothetical protein